MFKLKALIFVSDIMFVWGLVSILIIMVVGHIGNLDPLYSKIAEIGMLCLGVNFFRMLVHLCNSTYGSYKGLWLFSFFILNLLIAMVYYLVIYRPSLIKRIGYSGQDQC